MKRIIVLSLVAVAAMAALSCTKEQVKERDNGQKISFVIDSPDNQETKVSSNGTTTYQGSIRYRWKWDAEDALAIYSFNQVKDQITGWGNFITAEGGSPATFSGIVPDAYTGDTFIALYSKYTDSFKLFWNSTRYDFGFNIPAVQDGEGAKYALFAAMPTYDPSTTTLTFPTSGSYQFFLRTALILLEVPIEADVRNITMTVTTAKTGAAQNIVSSGSNKDVYINSSTMGIWGAASNTVTINNGGVLSDKVWIATRQVTTGNATNGYIKLTFVFTNGNGQTATKVAKLAKEPQEDGTATSYKSISNGVVNNLGVVSFTASDWN